MTTASDTTVKLIQDRIEILKREEEALVNQLIVIRKDAENREERHARTVAEREALEADLAALTVAAGDTIKVGDRVYVKFDDGLTCEMHGHGSHRVISITGDGAKILQTEFGGSAQTWAFSNLVKA